MDTKLISGNLTATLVLEQCDFIWRIDEDGLARLQRRASEEDVDMSAEKVKKPPDRPVVFLVVLWGPRAKIFDFRLGDAMCDPAQYMPSMPPAGIAGAGVGSLMSVTSASVVSRVAATDAAFCNALLVTLVGSRMPCLIMSQ